MTEPTIEAGICGFVTTVRTESSDSGMSVTIESGTICPHVEKVRAALVPVDPMSELMPDA